MPNDETGKAALAERYLALTRLIVTGRNPITDRPFNSDDLLCVVQARAELRKALSTVERRHLFQRLAGLQVE